jgi:hypothetical protein
MDEWNWSERNGSNKKKKKEEVLTFEKSRRYLSVQALGVTALGFGFGFGLNRSTSQNIYMPGLRN